MIHNLLLPLLGLGACGKDQATHQGQLLAALWATSNRKNDMGMEETGSTAKNGQNRMFSWACCKMATVRVSGCERVDHTSQEQWLSGIYKNDHI